MAVSRYATGGAGTTSRYASGGASRTTSRYSDGEGGAPAPPIAPAEPGSGWLETAKGAGRGLIDFISRPNYAAAGAAEEVFSPQGGGLAAVPGRIGSELFSGIGGIKGQKEGFAQVMEQAGVRELGKLSEVIPGLFNESGEGWKLKQGGWADPTGRGAIGLVGDIAFDPTTYLSLGGSTAGRFATDKGVKFLSKEGRAAKNLIAKEFDPALKKALAISDDALRITETRKIADAIKARVGQAIEADPKLLQSTGLKFAGQEVISRESLNGLSDTAKKVVTSIPGGGAAARGAEAMSRGIQRVFDPFADLAGLPPDIKDAMKGIVRENRSAAAMHKTNLLQKWHDIEPQWRQVAKKFGSGEEGRQALGKRFADWREQTAAVKLSPEESDLFGKIAKVYDDAEAVGLREGVLDPEQAAKFSGKYLHHEYKNPEVLSETVAAAGRPADRVIVNEAFQKPREFDTLADAVSTSRRLRAEGMTRRAAGAREKVYGELIPEYDAMKNLGSYIQQHTDAVWRNRTYAEVRDKLGLPLDKAFDPGLTRKLDEVIDVPPRERLLIDKLVGDSDKLKQVAETTEATKAEQLAARVNQAKDDLRAARSSGDARAVEQARRALGSAQSIAALKRGEWDAFMQRVPQLTSNLSKDGKRELARELMSRARSNSQVLKVEDTFGKDLLPSPRVIKEGQRDPYYAKLGQDGRMRTVSGGLWGESPVQLPEQIVKMMDGAPHDFVMDAARKRGLQGLVKAWDWYNNAFKAVTYPFYPSGAVRDTYNNVMQGFLGVGVGALARPTQAIRVIRGSADDVIRLGEREFTAKELKTMAKDLGVIDPSGAAYVQFTGEQGAERAGLLSKARAKRGSVDNLTRSQLFINNIAAGMEPADAAQVVKDFMFDYSELSAFDRDVMRRAIPFYVFPRKAIESYGKAAIHTPGRVANLAKPFRGREDENNAMTTWEGEGFKLRLDRNGKDITMLNGVDLPVRTLDLLWKGDSSKTANAWLSMASPAIKVPYEALSGQDPFRGKPLGRGQVYAMAPVLDKAPKIIQDWAGYKPGFDAAGRPTHTVNNERVQVLAEALLISRVLSTSDRWLREEMREPNKAARWLDFLTGLRFKTLNLDDEGKKRIAELTRIAEESAVKQGDAWEHRKVTPKAQ